MSTSNLGLFHNALGGKAIGFYGKRHFGSNLGQAIMAHTHVILLWVLSEYVLLYHCGISSEVVVSFDEMGIKKKPKTENQTTSTSAILSAILKEKKMLHYNPSYKSMCYWIHVYEIVRSILITSSFLFRCQINLEQVAGLPFFDCTQAPFKYQMFAKGCWFVIKAFA